MASVKRIKWLMPLFAVIVGIVFIAGMSYAFDNYPNVRELFGGSTGDVYGKVGVNSAESIAQRSAVTAKLSMWIFSVITVLQFIAFGTGYGVVSSIAKNGEPVELKWKQLENSDIFFDIPLYLGLFGTVSAFLVMNFSPQSSRLIAYSSTLIGIIFSLLLRLIMQYPLKQRLSIQLFYLGARK